MGKEAAILFLFGVFYIRVCAAASINRSSIDESSLLAFKVHINSEILAQNWSQETSFCTWIGVICSRRHPRVTGLDLPNMDLQGTIAKEIGNLSFLTFLDIRNNSIYGPIPSEIGNLRRLRILNLRFNKLSGHIPQRFGLLSKLERVSLSNNHLSGDIPKSLSTCVELKVLFMSDNNLTGNFPAWFGNLSQLQQLYLNNNQLRGELPPTVFNVSSLLIINVAGNQMSGSIPKHICSQPGTKLERLAIHFNQFEGEIPSSLMRCLSLKELSLGRNKFRGNIPSGFWNLTAIQEVSLARNEFTGTIPPSIGNFSNLVLLDISENSFHGTIPPEMGKVSSLTRLNLHINKLHGEVPQSMFNLSELQIFSLAGNNLSGSLPFSIDKGLPNIAQIYLSGNKFHGTIPNSISNLSTLTVLELSGNSFTGDIPVTLGKLNQLQFLNLATNQLTNNISEPEQDFLSSLTSCMYLKFIAISYNPLTGVIPKSLGSSNLSASLETFLAESCQITGPIPNQIGNLSRLLWLNLAHNNLTGAVPTSLGHLRSLQKLGIYSNMLQGSISHALCNMEALYSVDLAENNFFGQLPGCLGNLSMLREINLTYNAFNSSIPSTFWSNELVERMHFSYNFFDGSLSQDIGNMKSLIELELSGNQLSGKIPSTISQLQNLIHLSLSNNKLDGWIVQSFSDLKDLQYLDLSQNNLSGQIPKSLETLSYLNYFDVSFNELSGEIPEGGPFVNFTADSFRGNKGLCGAPRFKVEACKKRMPAPSRKNKHLRYILPGIALIVIAALILTLVWRCRGRKLSPSSLSDLPFRLMHERISYLEILGATSNLDEENLIGRGSFGSVYKGNFSDGMVAAVKVFNLDMQGALRSFDIECQIMRSIRHRNLVKVITSCSNLDFKALVMAYMPNGNLEKWLYSARCSLNLLQRLRIMIDVASAIEYLHEGYSFPIIHCDLKPNNILLDEEMVAHIGDFGIAKLLTQEQRMQQTRTLGTIGYMAPEYGLEGLISTTVDVYSYGILLMEMLSRRKPTDETFSGQLTIRRWMSESFPRSIVQIVDDELLNMDNESSRAKHESCLTSMIGLALECTADLPEERPNMKDVLSRMNKIKLNLSNHN